MAITYSTIFGLVIVIANTAVHFTEFTQKERMIWIHGAFYLVMFICGIVALAGQSEYQTQLLSKITQSILFLIQHAQLLISSVAWHSDSPFFEDKLSHIS